MIIVTGIYELTLMHYTSRF